MTTALDTQQAARALTDRIKVAVEGTWLLIQDAYTSRAWSALGYPTWDAYCTEEFGSSRLRLPREERQEVVASLRESGLSLRAIASATGIGYGTVRTDLIDAGEQNRSPAVVGADGKTYPTTRPAPSEPFAGGDWIEPDTQPGGDAPDEQAPDMPKPRPADATAPKTIGPAVLNKAGRLVPQRSQHKALANGISTLTGLCVGFAGLSEIDDGIDAEEAAQWVRDLSEVLRVLRSLNNKLKEHSHASH